MGESWADGISFPHGGRRSRGRNFAGRECWRQVMIGVPVAVAIAVFLSGVMVGVLALVAVAIRREERRFSLVGDAPDRLSRNARRLTGVGRRGGRSQYVQPTGQLVR
jgi:hypothetical protein